MNHKKWVLIVVASAAILTAACSRNSDKIDGPKPVLADVLPDLLCVEQAERQIQLSGEGLAPLMIDTATDNPGLVLPMIFLQQTADLTGADTSGEEVAVPEEDVTWQSQQSMTALIKPSMALAPGVYRVRVENGSGQQTVLEDALTIVPPPVLSAIDPDLVCIEQGPKDVTLTGEGFLEIDGILPMVTFGSVELSAKSVGGCSDVSGPTETVRICTSLVVEIPAGSLPEGLLDVVVANPEPAGCLSQESVKLLVVPPPEVEEVNPDLVCLEQGGIDLTITGTGFIDNDGTLPTVNVGSLSLPASSVSGCQDLEGPAGAVRSCTQLTVSLAQQSLTEGAHAVSVTNPVPVDCTSTEAVTIAVVPGPVIADVTPSMFCGDQQDVEVTVTGTGFLDVDGTLPTVEVGGNSYAAASVSDCVDVEGTLLNARSCTELTFTLPAGALDGGWQDITVRNPLPADCDNTSTGSFYLVGAPQIDRVSPTTPCEQNASDFTITGSGFLELGGEQPAVTIEGVDASITSMDGCVAIPNIAAASLCTSMRVTVPAGTVGVGNYDTTVTNPGEIPCSTTFTSYIGLPPIVSSVSPLQLCEAGGTITVSGDRFVDGSYVSITNGGQTIDLPTTYINAQTLEAEVPNPVTPGLYDITVTNPDGCADTLAATLDITPMPVIFFVDPPVVYNGINLQVTVYNTGILGAVIDVSINPTGDPGNVTALDFTYVQTNRVQAVVPSGLAAGDYDITVTDDMGCTGTLAEGLTIVEDLTVDIDRVELPFGWTDARTGVNIYSSETPDPGMVNFEPTPRFYLNPAAAGPGTLASELKYTAYVSPTRCSSTVPSGLPVGMYDLVAINPDGAVGLLSDAFEVTALPPPVIDALLPASVVNQDVQETIIAGANFRNPAFSADCLQPAGTTVPLVGDILASDANSIQVSFNFVTQTVADNSICIVKVTNDDGTYALYSALAVTNPSLNLANFSATSDMNTARRAPCAVAGDAAPGARFVYAIGGDDGTTQNSTATTYYDTVEMAAIDPYGDLGQWNVLPYILPAPRSFHACTTIGRYVFVAGGNGGAGAVDTVWRAKILDPEEAPEITDVDLRVEVESTAVLLPGRYSYRVSALRAAGDPENPGGETLAGDPLLIQTPDIDEQIIITITWEAVTGADGYRIYRTPDPDMPGGSEVQIGEVASTELTFVDDGTAVPGTGVPLPLGALGRFYTLPAMSSAREGAGIAWATDPADGDQKYLYMLGGRDESAAGLNTLERLDVLILADETQQIAAAWVLGGADIGPARWQLQAWVADDQTAPDIMAPGETWIYAGGGIRDDLMFLQPEMIALQVEAGGALGETAGCRYAVDDMQPFKAGYAAATFNNQIFAFGATMGNASTESASIELCPVGGACSMSIPDPPDLANWNNLGINLTVARYLMGGVTVSAFIFLVGGIDDGAPPVPLAATEKTLW